MPDKKLLMISIDRKIFEEGSNVRLRQIEYAKSWKEVHIIVAAGRSFREQHIAPNIWIYPTRSVLKMFYPFDAIRLGRFIGKRKGVDFITCQDPFFTAMAGVALKKELKVPLELQIHVDLGSPYYTYKAGNKFRKYLAVSYLKEADSIRVVSGKVKDYLVGMLGIPEKVVTVKPISVDIEWIRNAPVKVDLHKKYPQFSKIALMASRIEREKNIELAVRAWPDVVEEISDAGLIIVGEGSEVGHLKSIANFIGAASNIIFEPWVDRETLASYYKSADVFINTSYYEGYGMSIVEAKAAGCIVISTNVGVAQDIGSILVEYDKLDVASKVREAFRAEDIVA